MATGSSTSKAFGRRLRAARLHREWSQEELGRRTGRHWTYIGGLERGERNPSLSVIVDLATALGVSPAALVDDLSGQGGTLHPVLQTLNASAADVLDAIDKGFRARVDVKGKLAELFMFHALDELKRAGHIEAFEWLDVDGRPDFEVQRRGVALQVECKNIRNETYKRPPAYKVELQRTRNSQDGTPTRAYRFSDFDVLGVSTFNQTGRWDFFYVSCHRLKAKGDDPSALVVMQPVPIEVAAPWTDDPIAAMDDALSAK